MPDRHPEIDAIPEKPTYTDQLSFFLYEWAIYQKLVQSNAMNHLDIAQLLRQLIDQHFAQAFTFMDLACGDSSLAHSIMQDTQVTHYQGIDLSGPALRRAAKVMSDVPYQVEHLEEDMVSAVDRQPDTFDMIWCGFSIHHLETENQKQEMLNAVYRALKPGGIFVCFEPTCHNGESRETYLDRSRTQVRDRFNVLSDEEFAHMWQHIQKHDFPESPITWLCMGEKAGFARSSELFRMPGDLFCASFLYEKSSHTPPLTTRVNVPSSR